MMPARAHHEVDAQRMSNSGLAYVGTATVLAVFPSRTDSEGPIVVLDGVACEGVTSWTARVPRTIGDIFFTSGTAAIKEEVPINGEMQSALEHASGKVRPDKLRAYVVNAPISHERFYVMGTKVTFKILLESLPTGFEVFSMFAGLRL